MEENLSDYEVLDAACGGALYQVRHRRSGLLYWWRAHDCSHLAEHEARELCEAVRACRGGALAARGALLHAATRTLYVALQERGRSLAHFGTLAEPFLWRLLHELARLLHTAGRLQPDLCAATLCVDDRARLLAAPAPPLADPVRALGSMLRALCTPAPRYSRELADVVQFLCAHRAEPLAPATVLHHPAVLARLPPAAAFTSLHDVLLSASASDLNKCDSEKAGESFDTVGSFDTMGLLDAGESFKSVESFEAVKPAPRTILDAGEGPIYCNVVSKRKTVFELEDEPPSPTLAALALELPGYVPRRAGGQSPRRVSERTFSREWMSRLAALRRREDELNRRERELVAREIASSPPPAAPSPEPECSIDSNGITLPPLLVRGGPRRRRTSLRRRSRAYEDLDSSASADAGSPAATSARLTRGSLVRRDIFPELADRVHFSAEDNLPAAAAGFKYLAEQPSPRATRRRADIRASLARTPIAPDMKRKSRRSLLPFKTPFRFLSTK